MLTCSLFIIFGSLTSRDEAERNEKRYHSIDYGDYSIPTPRCVSSRTETFEAGV